MALALSDLFVTLTRDEVLDTILSVASTLGLKTTAWQPGQPGRTQLVIVAQKIADWTATTAEIAKGGLLDEARGGWLTLLARSLYNVERNVAEAATGEVTLTDSTGSAQGPFPAGDLTFAHATTGKTYRNTGSVTIPASGSITIPVQADEVGTDSDAAPGAIAVLVSSLIGVTVTNAAAVLGADDEEDDELVLRCREKLGSLSPNGPREAYSYVCKSLAETSSPITRTKVVASTTTGIVTCYVATATGAPSGADATACDDAIDAYATPLCVTAQAVGASELVVPVTVEVVVKGSSLSSAAIQTLVGTALAEYFKQAPIGGYVIPPATSGTLDLDVLVGTIYGAVSGVVRVTLSSPAADVAVAASQVPKLGAVTVNVVQVS